MRLSSALLVAAAVVAVSAPARADVDPAVSQKVNDLYKSFCTATLDPTDKNIDAAFSVYSPDYVNVDLKGKKMSRDEVIANAKQQLKVFHGTSCDTKIESITAPDANTLVVVSTNKVDGDIQAPDGKHEIAATSKSQDTWKLVNGAWVNIEGKDLRTLVKVDGNVVQDQGQ